MPQKHDDWKVEVFINLKASVQDPQGATVQRELNHMGYDALNSLRLGKYFTLSFDSRLKKTDVEKQVKQMCDKLLANPVIEQYRFKIIAKDSGQGKKVKA